MKNPQLKIHAGPDHEHEVQKWNFVDDFHDPRQIFSLFLELLHGTVVQRLDCVADRHRENYVARVENITGAGEQ